MYEWCDARAKKRSASSRKTENNVNSNTNLSDERNVKSAALFFFTRALLFFLRIFFQWILSSNIWLKPVRTFGLRSFLRREKYGCCWFTLKMAIPFNIKIQLYPLFTPYSLFFDYIRVRCVIGAFFSNIFFLCSLFFALFFKSKEHVCVQQFAMFRWDEITIPMTDITLPYTFKQSLRRNLRNWLSNGCYGKIAQTTNFVQVFMVIIQFNHFHTLLTSTCLTSHGMKEKSWVWAA